MSSQRKQETVESVAKMPVEAVDGSAAALRRRNKNLKIALGGIIVTLLLGCAFLVYNMWKYGAV